MGLLIPDEIELPETGLVTSNVYITFGMRTFSVVRYDFYVKKTPEDAIVVGPAPDCYIISNTIEFFNRDKTINYEHSNVQFFVTKEDISTIPIYDLAYRELRKLYPSAVNAI
jgi:hypothetical protein